MNPEAMGSSAKVFIQVTLDRQVEQALGTRDSRREDPEFMECCPTTGDSDYLFR